MKRLKQLFCHHEWEEEKLCGYWVIDGMYIRSKRWRCEKCGKIKYMSREDAVRECYSLTGLEVKE